MNNKSLCEMDSSDIDEIIILLEQREKVQQNIQLIQKQNSNNPASQENYYQTNELSQSISDLENQKNNLEQKVFNELLKISKFQNYFLDGYSTQFRQCMNYIEYQKLNIHQKLFTQDSNPDYFYIILKGQIGLFSSQQLYNEQDGYQYQGKTLIKISKLLKQNQNDSSQCNKSDATPKQKTGDINIKQKNNNNIDGQYYLLKTLCQGMQFGEISILMEQNRTSTAIALEDETILLKLNCQKFLQILKIREESKLFASLSCIKESSSINFLSFNALKDIFIKSYFVRFQRDQYVCMQNQYPKAAFLIQSGEFSLWSYTNLNSNKAPPSKEPYQTTLPKYHIKQDIKMSLLGVKEIFGDIEILSDENYQYSLKCESEGDILIIPREIYEAKVKQNELLIDIIKNKSSKINQKRLQLYKKFNQNLEVFRHFMYDADDTDEEDSGKIGYNKGYDVFVKSKFFKKLLQQENGLKGSSKNKKDEQTQQIDQLSFKMQQADKNQMKELLFLENINCYELNNQDKKNFYFTYKGSSNQPSSLNSSNNFTNQQQQIFKNKKSEKGNGNKKSFELLFQTNYPNQIERAFNSTKNNLVSEQNSSIQRNSNSLNSQQISQFEDSSNVRNIFYRNRQQRSSSRNQEQRTGQGFYSIQDDYDSKIAQISKQNVCYSLEQGVKAQEDSDCQSYSPTHSVGFSRQMQGELISQLSQRICKNDLNENQTKNTNEKQQRLSSRDQRKIIKKLQKQNKDLFKMKIDPKLRQKLIGYEKKKNFIEDYREQNLQIKRNSLHANQILKQLNYQQDQLQEFIKINQLENQENQQNVNILKINNQQTNSQRSKNKSMPHTPLPGQHNNTFIQIHRKNIPKQRPNTFMAQQHMQQDKQFLIARIEDSSSVQTPLTAPSSKLGVHRIGSPSKIQNDQFQLLVKQKPKTAIPATSRHTTNLVQQNKSNLNRESNSSFTSHYTANSEIDGFDKSQLSFEQNGYDINQYRQDRIKSQSFSLNIMNSLELGIQPNTPLNSNRIVKNNMDSHFIQRRQTFNCITNTVKENQQQVQQQQQQQKQQQQQQQMVPTRPPTGRQKLSSKEGRSQNNNHINQNSQISKNSLNNFFEDKKELIPQALVGNQIQLQKKQNRNSSRQGPILRDDFLVNNNVQNQNTLKHFQIQNSDQETREQIIEDNLNNKILNLQASPAQSFFVGNKLNITYQKQKEISREGSNEHQIQVEQQQKNNSQRRYISFDFRPPAQIRQQY
ncbi:cyclic nucleotide-binding domain protein (macronuclear) [Tetrahymena thermophila SB210]|uniref:Cyclic nucleotide-binding domain protein n=1 Tax=Tetrahymena thermophila (strain SB210) TaxID=312017 RepID=I7LTV4_TETTS|nr:cyclic nucleotide-binding domain protein [Tetrahymena thermophila SB210]EAR87358.2 cyclic nucleotide-binding domain protein [Tetrahymena thermophila SB210]|eukprot:XP_001007603.2 cyclic nucleotide-binding domain protein [Tetrahymena thermophila SB210]